MGIFWIFGGNGEPQGGGYDFLISVHSLDEAQAWLAANPQEWYQVWVWREGRFELEEPKPEKERKTKS